MNALLILIISIPIIEIYLFIKIGSQIGALATISLIFMTAFIGVLYARYEGFNTLKSGMSQLIKNELPIYEIVSGAALAFAALLLILPFNFFAFSFAKHSTVLLIDNFASGNNTFDKEIKVLYVSCVNETFLYFVISVIKTSFHLIMSTI